MDILTERGQRTVEQEREAASLFCSAFPSLDYINTPKDQPAIFDAFIVSGDTVVAAVECKCRQMTLHQFQVGFKSKWLITHQKLEDAALTCEKICVPLVGFLYLVPSRTLLIKRLWDPERKWVAQMDVAETRTQATVNGGIAIRKNAYVDMTGAKALTAP